MTNTEKSSNKATHRGSCQACGRVQAIEPNKQLIAKHGYTVDWGFFNGVCAGADHRVLEVDHSLTDSIIKQLREDVAPAADQRAADLRSGAVEPKWFKRIPREKRNRFEMQKYDDVDCARAELSDDVAAQQIRFAIHAAENKATQARSHATMLEKLIVARFGQPLVAINLEAKKVLAVGDRVNRGNAKKPRLVEVVEMKHMRVTGCGPYMNGKHMMHAILKVEDGRTFAVPTRLIRQSAIVKGGAL